MGMIIELNEKATMSNELTSMHIRKPMTLQQMRFFTIYLAKINPDQPTQKTVKFAVSDFASIMGVEVNESDIKKNVTNLLEHVVWVPSEKHKNGITACHLFKKCEMWEDEKTGETMLEFECSDEVEPYMFKLKNNFTTYEVWNTLRLRSVADSRMYQLLKQFQKVGERTISIPELKEQLGIDKNSYSEYKIFSRDVLKKCQEAMKKNTDIYFDYKAIGRPAKNIKFTIYKNENYDKQITLDEIGLKLKDDAVESEPKTPEEKQREFFREPFETINKEWEISDDKLDHIVAMIKESLPYGPYTSVYEKDRAVYEKLENILRHAKAEGARSIYGWLEFMFTNTDLLERY